MLNIDGAKARAAELHAALNQFSTAGAYANNPHMQAAADAARQVVQELSFIERPTPDATAPFIEPPTPDTTTTNQA